MSSSGQPVRNSTTRTPRKLPRIAQERSAALGGGDQPRARGVANSPARVPSVPGSPQVPSIPTAQRAVTAVRISSPAKSVLSSSEPSLSAPTVLHGNATEPETEANEVSIFRRRAVSEPSNRAASPLPEFILRESEYSKLYSRIVKNRREMTIYLYYPKERVRRTDKLDADLIAEIHQYVSDRASEVKNGEPIQRMEPAYYERLLSVVDREYHPLVHELNAVLNDLNHLTIGKPAHIAT